jgi:hypothetical protein
LDLESFFDPFRYTATAPHCASPLPQTIEKLTQAVFASLGSTKSGRLRESPMEADSAKTGANNWVFVQYNLICLPKKKRFTGLNIFVPNSQYPFDSD